VSIEAARGRLGGASTETTRLNALLAGQVAGTEIRTAPRRRERRPVIHDVINPAPVRPVHLTGRFPREGDMPGVVPSSAADA
jgi:hypothetical protein